MQKTLLPEVLAFILKNLPALDRALLDDVLPALEKSAVEFDALREKIIRKLSGFKREFPSNRGANAINDRTDKIRDSLMNGLTVLMEHYGRGFAGQNSTLAVAIEEQTQRVKKWVNTQYDPQNEAQVEEVRNRICSNMSAIPYANREIHAIRIRISEVYSELGTIHEALIAEMQNSVAGVLHECFPGLLADHAGLEGFIELAGRSGECPEIIDAVWTLNTLEVPFYNVIYPELRKQVFDSMNDLEKNFLLFPDKTPEKQAAIALGELRNIGFNWIWKAETLLHSQTKITEIICAALERFQDRMIRNAETRRELVGLVEYFWGDIQNEGAAYGEDIRSKLEKIQK